VRMPDESPRLATPSHQLAQQLYLQASVREVQAGSVPGGGSPPGRTHCEKTTSSSPPFCGLLLPLVPGIDSGGMVGAVQRAGNDSRS
jgi:hypothetical protein